MSLPTIVGASYAYANHGRWVADCSHSAACDSAVELRYSTSGFICADCQRTTEVIWPAIELVESVERLLLMRPNRKNQNWLPTETLADLIHDNAAHGVFTRHAVDGFGAMFKTLDNRIVFDPLPTLNPRKELAR